MNVQFCWSFWAEFLDIIVTKSPMSFPPCYSQSPGDWIARRKTLKTFVLTVPENSASVRVPRYCWVTRNPLGERRVAWRSHLEDLILFTCGIERFSHILRRVTCRNRRLTCTLPYLQGKGGRFHWEGGKCFCLVLIRDTSYTRPVNVIALFSCPLSWSVHYNFAVVSWWKLSRLSLLLFPTKIFQLGNWNVISSFMVYKSLLKKVL